MGSTFAGSLAWQLPAFPRSKSDESEVSAGPILLNRNESAYGPSTRALAAIRARFSDSKSLSQLRVCIRHGKNSRFSSSEA